jgi:hypothetical protein
MWGFRLGDRGGRRTASIPTCSSVARNSLVAIDPAGEDQEQQLPRLQNRLHICPDIVRKVEGFGIRSSLSTAGKRDCAVQRNSLDIGTCGSAEFIDHTGSRLPSSGRANAERPCQPAGFRIAPLIVLGLHRLIPVSNPRLSYGWVADERPRTGCEPFAHLPPNPPAGTRAAGR